MTEATPWPVEYCSRPTAGGKLPLPALPGVDPPPCPALTCRSVLQLASDGDRTRARKHGRMHRTVEHVLTDHVRNLDPALEDSWRERV